MPTNQTKSYNQLLDFLYPSLAQNIESFRRVYDRDFQHILPPLSFRNRPVLPTVCEGENEMDRMFRHLTTVTTDDKTKKRDFESERAIRIHWIRQHLMHLDQACYVIFEMPDEANRIYIFNRTEKYVIIMEPQRGGQILYLITAYHLGDSGFKKISNKQKKRGKLI